MKRVGHAPPPLRLLAIAGLAGVLAGTTAEAAPAPGGAEPEARFLVIALDAVPFRSAAEVTRGDDDPPLLADLAGPVPLVSTFPSSTSIALTAMLSGFGLEDPPGYEAKFFDRSTGRIRGGGLISYGRIRFDWHHFFDWQLRGFFTKSKVYAWPYKYNVRELEKALAAFVVSDRKSFFVYVNSTDATGHIHGPRAFGTVFEALDRLLPEARSRVEEPLYVVVFSDHGLGGGDEILDNARPAIFRALRGNGWAIRGRLDRPGSVVLSPFGLVSSAEIYTRPGDEAAVAEIAAGAEGVDLCAYRQNDGWMVVDSGGTARIERRRDGSGGQWTYRPESGDPLHYRAVVERLGGETDDDWIDESAWLDSTWNATYPDALYRIAAGFERVTNPASVLCSIDRGYLYGSKSAYLGARLSIGRIRWTHGALAREETLGFLMTDFPGWEASGALRFDQALDFLVEHLDGSGGALSRRGEP